MQINGMQGVSVGESGASTDSITISGPDAEELKAALSNMLSKNQFQSGQQGEPYTNLSTTGTDGLSDEDKLKLLLQRLEGNSSDDVGANATPSTGGLSGVSNVSTSNALSSNPDGLMSPDADYIDDGDSSDVSGDDTSSNTSELLSDGLMNPNANYIDISDDTSTSGDDTTNSGDGLMDPNASYVDTGDDTTTTDSGSTNSGDGLMDPNASYVDTSDTTSSTTTAET
jgi:hypothetical protein